MSCDKNTLNFSEVDATIKVLEELCVPYSLTILGRVMGHGLNDDMGESSKYYPMRKLRYKGLTMLEQIHRTRDCDSDDVIISRKFTPMIIPKDWKIEVIEPEDTEE